MESLGNNTGFESCVADFSVGEAVEVELWYFDGLEWRDAEDTWCGIVRPKPMGHEKSDTVVNIMPDEERGIVRETGKPDNTTYAILHPRLLTLEPVWYELSSGEKVQLQYRIKALEGATE